jgi:tetratricopeptide (TPR) repeat protein
MFDLAVLGVSLLTLKQNTLWPANVDLQSRRKRILASFGPPTLGLVWLLTRLAILPGFQPEKANEFTDYAAQQIIKPIQVSARSLLAVSSHPITSAVDKLIAPQRIQSAAPATIPWQRNTDSSAKRLPHLWHVDRMDRRASFGLFRRAFDGRPPLTTVNTTDPVISRLGSSLIWPELRISLGSDSSLPFGSSRALFTNGQHQAESDARPVLEMSSVSASSQVLASKPVSTSSSEFLDNVAGYQVKLKLIRSYNKTISLHPSSAFTYYRRGNLLLEIGELMAARKDFDQALRLDSRLQDAFINRGVLRRKIGDLNGAVSDYTSAIQISPSDVVAFKNRGIAYEQLGNVEAALLDWQRAAELGDLESAQWLPKKSRLTSSSRWSQRNNVNRQEIHGLAVLPDSTSARRVSTIQRQSPPKLQASRAMTNSEGAYSYFKRANIALLRNNLDAALIDYNKALALDRGLAKAFNNRGVVKRRLGDYSGALGDYDQALRLLPQDADAYKNRGMIKELLGDLAAACLDWGIAASYGNMDANDWSAKQCHVAN